MLLTGKPPFDGEDAIKIIKNMRSKVIDKIALRDNHVSESCIDLIN